MLLRGARWAGLGLSLLVAGGLSGFLAMRYAIRGTVVVLPDLKGKTITEAGNALQQLGLSVNVLARKPDPQVPPHVILTQDPIAGTPVKPNQMVRVIVSSGQRQDAVPQLVGSSLRVAQMTVVWAGHTLGDVVRIHHGPERADEILQQTPSPEDSTGASETVHVLVNVGPRERAYVMPDLVGREINETIRLFERGGMRIESVEYRSDSGFPKGTILAQQPERGQRLTAGSPVRLEVSR